MAGCLIKLINPKTSETPAAKAVEAAIGHIFSDRSLLERALTHASVSGGRSDVRDLERLEFLGDRVLGLMAAEALWRRFPKFDEGDMAPRLNAMVRKETCADAARAWNVGPALHISTGEERAGGRDKNAILGDSCEALLGALYVDGGLPAARVAFDTFWGVHIDQLVEQHLDPKTALQEWAQRQGHGTPTYSDTDRFGPDHAPRFRVCVHVGELPSGEGEGSNKREAQMAAAKELLIREKVWTDHG